MKSKRTKYLLLFLLAGALIAGAIYFAYKTKKSNTVAEEKNLSIINESRKTVAITDTDGDGLADWEEALWKTDPANQDTDGDGTSDGEEVSQGRNPSIKGPNDKDEPIKTTASSSELTLREKFSREFFADYLKLKQSGNWNDASASTLINEMTEGLKGSLSAGKSYTEADLKSRGSSAADMKAFGNELVLMLSRTTHQSKKNELELLVEWLETQDKSVLEKMDVIVKSYKGMSEQSPELVVPEKLLTRYVSLVNDFNLMYTLIQSFRNVDKDAISALAAVSTYENTSLKMFKDLLDVIYDILGSGAQFTPEEPGYILYNFRNI
jgi:hypothetical protein